MKRFWMLLPAAMLAGGVQAGERLTADELRAFYSGKTVTGEHFRRGLSHTYYDPDGSVRSVSEDGTERLGKWWIDEEEDKRCVRWNHKARNFCHYVERDDDGSYVLIHGGKGKRLVEIRGSEDGNRL